MAGESRRGFGRPGTFVSQDAVAGPMVETAGASFTLCPHKGVVSLETANGVVCLVHHETQEIVPLPSAMQAGAVELDCDEGGFAYVYSDSADDIVWADDLFSLQLARDSAGRRTLLRAKHPGPPDFAVLHDEYCLCADEGVLQVDVPCGPNKLALSATVFRVPRAGSRLFLDVYHVLKGLSFTAMSTAKTASRFVYKRIHRWCSFLSRDLGFDGQLIKSAQYASHRRQHGDDARRQGAAPQLSLLALVALLARWSGAPRASGGSQAQMDRECAFRMLKALSAMGLGDNLRMEAFVDLRVWHNGFAKGQCKIAWKVSGDGSLELISEFWRMGYAKKVGDLMERPNLLDLLVMLVSSPRHADVFKQVVHQVAMVWQMRLLQQVEGVRHLGCTAELRIGHELGSTRVSKQDIQRRLMVYWASGRDWARDRKHMAVAVDKSRVGGRAKQNGAVLFPDNYCFWMLPQELGGGGGVGPAPAFRRLMATRLGGPLIQHRQRLVWGLVFCIQ